MDSHLLNQSFDALFQTLLRTMFLRTCLSDLHKINHNRKLVPDEPEHDFRHQITKHSHCGCGHPLPVLITACGVIADHDKVAQNSRRACPWLIDSVRRPHGIISGLFFFVSLFAWKGVPKISTNCRDWPIAQRRLTSKWIHRLHKIMWKGS